MTTIENLSNTGQIDAIGDESQLIEVLMAEGYLENDVKCHKCGNSMILRTKGETLIKTRHGNENVNYNHSDELYEHKFNKKCELQSWNGVSTFEIPNEKYMRKLANRKVTGMEGLHDGELRLLSAYLYPDEIVVTTTRQIEFEVGKTIYCRYYDCNRVEIPNSAFKSYLFPMTAAHCLRRAGAQFISLSFQLSDEPQEPIPYVKRLEQKAAHDLGVCVGQIYGVDRKWMDLVEFVEHHKILGATMFYFTVFEIEEYSRKLLNEYVRTGYAEVTDADTEYTQMFSYAHMIQLYDCTFRARRHSKWLLNIDHDEYLIPNINNFFNYIDSLAPQYAEVIIAMRRLHKSEKSLEVYNNTAEVRSNIQMAKYNQTAHTTYLSPKSIVQPTKVEAMHIHWSYGRSAGYRSISLPKTIAVVNHYRGNTGLLISGKIDSFESHVIDDRHLKLMTSRIVKKVEYVFKKHNVTCESVPDAWKNLTLDYLKKIKIC